MPTGLIGFVCPQGTPTEGNRNKVEFCLAECPHPCVAEPLLAAIHHANHINYHKGAYLSASMLAGSNCMRRVYFERFDENGYYDLPRSAWWPYRGTVAHAVVEERGEEAFHLTTYMQEIRMTVDLVFEDQPMPIFDAAGEWTGKFDKKKPLVITVKGSCDCYSPWKRRLYDFKTMADSKARMVVDGKQDESWVVQTNIYGYLIAKTKITDEDRELFRKHGLPELDCEYYPQPESIHIQGLSMQELPMSGRNYVMQRTYAPKMVPPIPVMPLDEVEAIIRARAIEWYNTLVLKKMPPPVDDTRDWMCKGCVFNGEVIEGERCFPKQERSETGLSQTPPVRVTDIPDKAPVKKRGTRKKKSDVEFG